MVAGDWMMIDLELSDKPEVHQIAELLKLEPDAVVGKLFRVWSWFNKQTVNGHAVSVTDSVIDRLCASDGFSNAMLAVGWLDDKSGGLRMPKFDRWNGQSSKKRALASRRQAKKRHADVTRLSRLPRDENVTKEEKEKRERKDKRLPLTRLPWLPPWIPEEPWNGWLEMRKKKHVPNTDRAMRLAVNRLTTLKAQGQDILAVIDNATESGWTKFWAVRSNGGTSTPPPAKVRPCGHCQKPIVGGYTRMKVGDVCDPCRKDYMEGKWK